MPTPEAGIPAEQFLIDIGTVAHRTPQREQVLACIGCHFLSECTTDEAPIFFGSDIAQCTGMPRNFVLGHVMTLKNAEVIQPVEGDPERKTGKGGTRRQFYGPADSEKGRLFLQSLRRPEICTKLARIETAEFDDVLKPGDIVTLENFDELSAFEEVMASAIDPAMSPKMRAAWDERFHIRSLLFPQLLAAQVRNCRLTVEDRAFEALAEAEANNWFFDPSNQLMQFDRVKNETFRESLRLFRLAADLLLPDKNQPVPVQALLWYGSVPVTVSHHVYNRKGGGATTIVKRSKQTQLFNGASVARYATLAEIRREDREPARESTRMTLGALQEKLSPTPQ